MDALPTDADERELEGSEAWLAVDLSSTTDLTAIAIVTRQAGRFYLFTRFFCPAATIRRAADRDHVPYPLWAEQGHLRATLGAVSTSRWWRKRSARCASASTCRSCLRSLRRPRAHETLQKTESLWSRCGRVGRPEPCHQGAGEGCLGQGNRHGRQSGAAVVHPQCRGGSGQGENLSFHKSRSTGRIDGAVAAAMAIGRASHGGEGGALVYEDVGARPDGFLVI